MNSTTSSERWIPLADGRLLYAECSGSGTPAVVFEAGLGCSRLAWAAVTPLLAGRVDRVVYDRSGLGRSPADSAPRDLARLAGDLAELLDQLGSGPFVLVGHSWGGPIVRVAAAARPDRIAGIVLVDPSDERCDLFFRPGQARVERIMRPVTPALARLGVFRLAVRRIARRLPPDASALMRAEDGTSAAIRTALAEMASWRDDLWRLRDEPLAPPEFPVTIVSGARAGRLERARRAALLDAHRASAAAAPLGRHITAPDSGHLVLVTDPQLVADEALRLVDLTPSTPGGSP